MTPTPPIPPEVVARNSQEMELLTAFHSVYDQVDREYLISVTRKRAEAQKPRKPTLRIVG